MPLELNHLTLHPGLNGELFCLTVAEDITDESGAAVGTQRVVLDDPPLEILNLGADLINAVIAQRGYALTLADLQARELARRPAVDPLPEGVGP